MRRTSSRVAHLPLPTLRLSLLPRALDVPGAKELYSQPSSKWLVALCGIRSATTAATATVPWTLRCSAMDRTRRFTAVPAMASSLDRRALDSATLPHWCRSTLNQPPCEFPALVDMDSVFKLMLMLFFQYLRPQDLPETQDRRRGLSPLSLCRLCGRNDGQQGTHVAQTLLYLR